MGGVGPDVAEVEVDHQPQSQAVGPARLHEHVLHVVPALGGVHPHAQPDGIDATLLLEQRHALLRLALGVVEDLALVLQLTSAPLAKAPRSTRMVSPVTTLFGFTSCSHEAMPLSARMLKRKEMIFFFIMMGFIW